MGIILSQELSTCSCPGHMSAAKPIEARMTGDTVSGFEARESRTVSGFEARESRTVSGFEARESLLVVISYVESHPDISHHVATLRQLLADIDDHYETHCRVVTEPEHHGLNDHFGYIQNYGGALHFNGEELIIKKELSDDELESESVLNDMVHLDDLRVKEEISDDLLNSGTITTVLDKMPENIFNTGASPTVKEEIQHDIMESNSEILEQESYFDVDSDTSEASETEEYESLPLQGPIISHQRPSTSHQLVSIVNVAVPGMSGQIIPPQPATSVKFPIPVLNRKIIYLPDTPNYVQHNLCKTPTTQNNIQPTPTIQKPPTVIHVPTGNITQIGPPESTATISKYMIKGFMNKDIITSSPRYYPTMTKKRSEMAKELSTPTTQNIIQPPPTNQKTPRVICVTPTTEYSIQPTPTTPTMPTGTCVPNFTHIGPPRSPPTISSKKKNKGAMNKDKITISPRYYPTQIEIPKELSKYLVNLDNLGTHQKFQYTMNNMGQTVTPQSCRFCSMILPSERQCKIHERIHFRKTVYQCDTCGLLEGSTSCFMTHLERAHTKNSIKQKTVEEGLSCPVCKVKFKSRSTFVLHKKRCINTTCKVCNQKFIYKKRLDRHMKTHIFTEEVNVSKKASEAPVPTDLINLTAKDQVDVNKKASEAPVPTDLINMMNKDCETCPKTGRRSAKCELCGQHIPSTDKISHLLDKHKDEAYHCDKQGRHGRCAYVFATQAKLAKHREKQHESVDCDICSISVKRYKLNAHKESHGEKTLACKTCGKLLASRRQMFFHERSHISQKKHKCTSCEKSYYDKGALESHMNTVHTGKRPYGCDQCKAKFATRLSLKRHMIKHSGDKNFVCDVCGKSFYFNDRLLEHKRYHLPVTKRPYKCEVCSSGFTNSTLLRYHMTKHQKWTCNICNKTLCKKYMLQNHMKEHSVKKLRSCSSCDKVFNNLSELKNHKKSCQGSDSSCDDVSDNLSGVENHNKSCQGSDSDPDWNPHSFD